MDNIFLIKLAISFVLGGLWVILASVAADKFGSKIGGLISGMPSTIAFAMFFIAWTQTVSQAVQATTIFPIIEGIDCLFIAVYCFLVRKNFWFSMFASFLVWGVLSYILVIINFNSFGLSLISYVVLLLVSFVFIEKMVKVKSLPGKKIKYSPMVILFRGIFSGLVISFSVLIGKIGGPIWGGVFSAFPAMITNTIIISYFSQGAEFSIATMKSMLISIGSVIFYCIFVRYLYPVVGIGGGTLLSLVLSYICSAFLYKFVIKKIS